MIRRVGIRAEELEFLSLLADGNFIAPVHKPVPLIVRHIVGIVQRRIDESAPYCSAASSGCVNLVRVILGRSVSVLAIDIANVDDKLSRQLRAIAYKPLSNISLVTVWIEGLAKEACRTSGRNYLAILASVRVVVSVRLCDGAGCGRAQITGIGDIGDFCPACADHVLLILCKDIGSAYP